MSSAGIVFANSARTNILKFGKRVYQQSTSPIALTALGWTTIVSPALAAGTSSSTAIARCDGDGGNPTEDWMKKLQEMSDQLASQAGTQIQGAIDSGIPTQLSYGFVSGYASGYALKKAGRVAAVVFGMGFMALQSLQHMGYVEVNHARMKEDVESILDLNKDGKIDQEDAKVGYDRLMEVITLGIPAGGGFGAGFIGGLRSG